MRPYGQGHHVAASLLSRVIVPPAPRLVNLLELIHLVRNASSRRALARYLRHVRMAYSACLWPFSYLESMNLSYDRRVVPSAVGATR